MNVTFVYSCITVEKVNNKYYHNFLGDIIFRYSQLGALTVCTSMVTKNGSHQNEIDFTNVKYVEVKKENTVKNILDRRYNRSILKKAIECCDLLIVHVPDSVSNMAARYAKKIGKTYLSVVIGCVWDALWNHSIKGKLLAPSAFLSMKGTVWNADYVMYVTNEFLQRRYPTNGKHIGCSDVVLDKCDKQICLKRKNKFANLDKSEEIKIVTIGGLDVSYKGQKYIIKALKTVIQNGLNYHYYLIGGGEGQSLYKLAKKMGIENHVHFLGILNHNKINECLINMDIYAQPSKQEGLPRAVVEAMNTGMPCIGTNVGGIPELLPQELVFAKGNIADIITLLEVNPITWSKYVDFSFNRAKEYAPEILDKRRTDFFQLISSEISSKHSN